MKRRLNLCATPIRRLPSPLPGAHQKQNASLALAALRSGGIAVGEQAIAQGLANVDWPARFQRWDERTIIDGAHNPAGARILAQTWREQFGDERATIILAVLLDKDVPGICQALAPISDPSSCQRSAANALFRPRTLARTLSSITPALPYSITPSIADALNRARQGSNRILLTGSLHFAGEALAEFRGDLAAFEECAQ